MKKVAVALMSIAAVATLSACGSSHDSTVSTNGDSQLIEATKLLSDGRTVTCIIENIGGYREGLSCDWEGAK